jgi:hypothetical protein
MEQQDRECIAHHQCPVCHYGAKTSCMNARKALQEHIRRSSDPLHRMWREVFYRKYYPHGGNMITNREPCADDIITAIKRVYGDQWGSKCEEGFQAIAV